MGIIFRDEEGFDEVEVVVAGRNNVKVGGKGERAEKLFLHYAQRSEPLLDLLLLLLLLLLLDPELLVYKF